VLPLVTRRVRLEQAEGLFTPGETPEGLKILLVM
jgi:hypothetical protein